MKKILFYGVVFFILWKVIPIENLIKEYQFANALDSYEETLVLLYNRTTSLVNEYIENPSILEDESYRFSVNTLLSEIEAFSSTEPQLEKIQSRSETYDQVQKITSELKEVQKFLALWMDTEENQYIQEASKHMKQIKSYREDLVLIYNREKSE